MISRLSQTLLARALFATDPRILAILARVDDIPAELAPDLRRAGLLRRAWLVEHDIREESKARAEAAFQQAGIGWDWSDYPGMREAARHQGLADELGAPEAVPLHAGNAR